MNSIEDRQLKITFDNKEETTCFPGTLVKNIIKKHRTYDPDRTYIGALVNNRVVTMTYPVDVDSEITMLTMADSHGWRVYRNSVAFLLSKAAYECFPEYQLEIKHSLNESFYCSFDGVEEKKLPEILVKIEQHMRKDVEDRLSIVRRKVLLEDAIFHFASKGREDKCNLLRFQNPPKVAVYLCGDFVDLAHGALSEDTKDLEHFKLLPYDSGFILQFPEKKLPIQFVEFKEQKHLFDIFKAYSKWGKTIGIKTVGNLNEIIIRGEFKRLVDVEECFQEKKIAEIADCIYARKDDVKWVLIAGPSSSGKTTFAYRLLTQLKVNGITPVVISVDNYFVDREKTPRDESGDYDFEHINTLDLDLLQEHLNLLDKGEEVEIPIFDFKEGRRMWTGHRIKLKDHEVGVIEGIHSLNPVMTSILPPERKYKIYINALTQLNLDYNNRISTTDCRLIRRIIRDHRTRGNRALKSMKMWESVRVGEKRWIFPYQQQADIAFSSALNYELAVQKPLVEPLLCEIKPWHPQYSDARRILDFLSNFVPAPSYDIPRRSLVREFIGGGILG